MSAGTNGGNGHERRSVISKDSLIPLGIVIALMFTAFSIGSQWQAIRNAVTAVESKAADHEKRVKLLEASMVFWRREVEHKLGPLPDFQPINEPPNGDSNDAQRRTGNLQVNQMLIHDGRPSSIDRQRTVDGTGRDHGRQAPSVDRHSDEGVGGN